MRFIFPAAAAATLSAAGAAGAAPTDVRLADTTPPSALYAFATPGPVPAGATRFTLRNDGRGERGAQLVRVDGAHTPRAILAAVRAAARGRPLAGWLHPGGGMGVVRPGTTSFTVDLRAGSYYVVDRSRRGRGSVPPTDALIRLDVVDRAARAPLPDTAAELVAFDGRFRATGLRPGRRAVTLRNAGSEPHDIVLAPMRARATLADVLAFAGGDESGRPPVDFAREVVTGVISPGDAQTVTLELRRGRYALLCFAADRSGGPPHVAQGMATAVRVR